MDSPIDEDSFSTVRAGSSNPCAATMVIDRQRSAIEVYVANGKRLMSIGSQESKPLPATLERRIAHGADAAQIAAAIVSTWKEIDAALTPVLGQQGVAALYKRSLYLTSPVYPWLSGIHEGVVNAMDLSTLNPFLHSKAAPPPPQVAMYSCRRFMRS